MGGCACRLLGGAVGGALALEGYAGGVLGCEVGRGLCVLSGDERGERAYEACVLQARDHLLR